MMSHGQTLPVWFIPVYEVLGDSNEGLSSLELVDQGNCEVHVVVLIGHLIGCFRSYDESWEGYPLKAIKSLTHQKQGASGNTSCLLQHFCIWKGKLFFLNNHKVPLVQRQRSQRTHILSPAIQLSLSLVALELLYYQDVLRHQMPNNFFSNFGKKRSCEKPKWILSLSIHIVTIQINKCETDKFLFFQVETCLYHAGPACQRQSST